MAPAPALATALPASQRPLSLLVYGATGFTGKYVCEYLAKTALASPSINWGIAGRNQGKLEALSHSLQKQGFSPPSLLLLADNQNPSSLEYAAAQTRLFLNCTGPYRFLGEEPLPSFPPVSLSPARALLAWRSSLPSSLQGGVYTPGAIFYEAPDALWQRLENAGLRFEILEDGFKAVSS
ncbi:hypothetical protein NSK_007798 [Nannochloropsis salina CCMP1776]|uniref:Uncharacterized protein n=1 Tax=Nannochloropsis salina CCMP1776 TaxID=1027361 RepID=A0A4D9CNY2_9STRA|nr:hypothetical protein NSK_007798 [Nannochloropsis salina CCMP1776]|eukprot:TFJ80871.1 hypothetical protein NSK_007798 [Nannochloropsis salina CCMP1776]